MTTLHENSDTQGLHRAALSLPIALLRARETVMGPLRAMLAKSPVNEQKWRVLRVLEKSGEQDQNSIAKAACLLLPSLTRILRAMEEDGLISRREDTQDRRRSIVTIQPAGRKILEDYAVEADRLAQDLRRQFGDEKLELLLDLLEDLQRIDIAS